MLQGSLENFALDEVLGLLSGTSKTGQLEISGNRGTGSLMFDEGRLVDASASYTANGVGLEDVMFELLRYDDGTFTFTNREVTLSEKPENVATVLASAENRLRDWRSIEAVVPTLNHQVAPSAVLPADEVTVTRAEWAALTVIAAGCPVSQVCDRLDLGEVEGSRQIKNLAERELVVVSEPIGGFNSAYRASTSTAPPVPAPIPAPLAADERPGPDAVPATPPSEFATESSFESSESFDSAAAGSALDSLIGGQRPPMPPMPAPDELAADQLVGAAVPAPAPPSPAEISTFGESIEDASELVEAADETKSGGLLARYLKSDD